MLEYAFTIQPHVASTTNITKLQTIQNTALCIATSCTLDTNNQHLHDETNILSLHPHLNFMHNKLDKSQHSTHLLNSLTKHTEKRNNYKYTTDTMSTKKMIRTTQATAPSVNTSKASLPKEQLRTLAHLRTNKFLSIIPTQVDVSPLCPFCNTQVHDTKR